MVWRVVGGLGIGIAHVALRAIHGKRVEAFLDRLNEALTTAAPVEPPTNGAGNDWVLVLDDAAKGYPAPGAAK